MTTLSLTPLNSTSVTYVTAPSGIASGECAVWNGSAFVRSTVTKVGYSSLSLTGAVLNADLAGSIAATKVSGTAVTQADTGTVTSTMILDGTILNADINASAAIARSKLQGWPHFRVYRSSTQTISTATATKVQLNSLDWDADSYFDTATNYRYTPQVAGKYRISVGVSLTGLTSGANLKCMIYYNGSARSSNEIWTGATGDIRISHTDDVPFNGTTDYVELYIYHTHGSNRDTIANAAFMAGNWLGT